MSHTAASRAIVPMCSACRWAILPHPTIANWISLNQYLSHCLQFANQKSGVRIQNSESRTQNSQLRTQSSKLINLNHTLCLLPSARCLHFTVYRSLFALYSLQFTIHHSLFPTHHSPFPSLNNHPKSPAAAEELLVQPIHRSGIFPANGVTPGEPHIVEPREHVAQLGS